MFELGCGLRRIVHAECTTPASRVVFFMISSSRRSLANEGSVSAFAGLEKPCAGRAEGQDYHVRAILVHLLQAVSMNIEQIGNQ